MISKKLSLNKVCIILATTILLLSVVMFSVLYILTKEMSVVFCSMAFCLLFLLCVTVFVILIRRKLTLFSEILCCTLDEMMNGKIDISQVAEEENLFYKINHRLVRLYEVMQESKNSVASERADLQELISDISHQVKTPIANLKMVNHCNYCNRSNYYTLYNHFYIRLWFDRYRSRPKYQKTRWRRSSGFELYKR